MISYLISAVPEVLEDIWYVYDLILIGVIAVLAVSLIFLKKRSNYKEGEKNFKAFKNLLKKAESMGENKARIVLFTAKNLAASAIYYYGLCIEENDKYDLIKALNSLNGAVKNLDDLLKDKDADIKKGVREILSSL